MRPCCRCRALYVDMNNEDAGVDVRKQDIRSQPTYRQPAVGVVVNGESGNASNSTSTFARSRPASEPGTCSLLWLGCQ